MLLAGLHAVNDWRTGLARRGTRGLDAIEQAIRNAFAKGNPEDPAFRERVYRSAYAALEKALQANTALAPEIAERRRKALMSAVSSIESEVDRKSVV